MNTLVFWNELAERPLASDRRTARERMDALVDVLAALQREVRGMARPRIRCAVPLDGVQLADDYTVAKWRLDTDQARRLLFLQMMTSSPLLRAAEDPAEAMHAYGCADCWHGEDRAQGLRAAWAAGELSVSLDSHSRWRDPFLNVELEVLGEDDELERRTERVRHLAVVSHVHAHRDWLANRRIGTISDGRALWDQRREVLPNLEFCNEVEKQLVRLDAGSPELRNVLNRLCEMDEQFARWDGSPIHPSFLPSKCSPETQQTLKEEAADHTATRRDGRAHLFSWHVRFTPGGGRIFFDGDPTSRTGLVGYVGFKKDGRLT